MRGLLLIFAVGCGAVEPIDDAAPPAPSADRAPSADAAPAAGPAPARAQGSGFVYEGWPGEGRPVLTVTREIGIALADRPGGPGGAPCTVARGETLDFERSVVRTERPGEVTLDAPHPVPPGSTNFGAVSGLSREQQYAAAPAGVVPAELRPDQRIEHLAYRAEGTCYYRVEREVLGTMCFHDAAQDAATSWWVRTTCGGEAGWLRVDTLNGVEIGRQL